MMFLHYISILLLLVCAVCSSDEFKCIKGTQLFQHADGSFECLVCSDCPRGLVKVKNCSLEYDTTCESCNDHSYYHDEEPHCRSCSKCFPGEFINRNCSKFFDTECKPCSNGTFSSHINSNSCAKCRECSRGLVEVKNFLKCSNGTFSSHTNSSSCTNCSKCTEGYISECNSTQNSICKISGTESNGINIAVVVVTAVVGVVVVLVALVAVLLCCKRKNGVTKKNNAEEINLSQTGPAVACNGQSVPTLPESNSHHGPQERSEEENMPLLPESSIKTRTPTGDVTGGNVEPTGVEVVSGGEAITAQDDTGARENQSTSGAVEEAAGGNQEPIQVEAGSGEEAIRAQDDTGSRENQSTSGAIEDAGGNHEPIQDLSHSGKKSGILILHCDDDQKEAEQFRNHLWNDIDKNLKISLSGGEAIGRTYISAFEYFSDFKFILVFATKNLKNDSMIKAGSEMIQTKKFLEKNFTSFIAVFDQKEEIGIFGLDTQFGRIDYWKLHSENRNPYIESLKKFFRGD